MESPVKIKEILRTAYLTAVKGAIKDVYSKYLDEIATVLIEKNNEKINSTDKDMKKWTRKEVMDIFYHVTKNVSVTLNKPGRSKKIDQENYGTCKYQEKHVKCINMISKRSQTKEYCAKHLKLVEKKSNLDENGKVKTCDQALKTGMRIGYLCGKNVTPKSSHLCSKHHNMEEKVKRDKMLKDHENESEDEEMEDEDLEDEEQEIEVVKKEEFDYQVNSEYKTIVIIGSNKIRYHLRREPPHDAYAKLIHDKEVPLDKSDKVYLTTNGHTYEV